MFHDRPPVLHSQSHVEAELVPAGFRRTTPSCSGKNEIDDKALIDLWGVVKVSEVTVHGISVLNFDGFAPAPAGKTLSVFTDK